MSEESNAEAGSEAPVESEAAAAAEPSVVEDEVICKLPLPESELNSRANPEPEESPAAGLIRMGIAFAVLFVANLIYGWANGTLMPTVIGLTLAPLLGALVVRLSWSAIRDLKRGPRQRGVIVLFVLVAVIAYLVSGHYARSMLFPGNRSPLPAAGTQFEGGRVIGYTTSDGIELKGFLIRGRGAEPRPAVVHFHGNADAVANNLGWANMLADRNLDVFVAEYRGYAGCAGSPSEAGLRLDARAALAALEKETGTPPSEVILSGQSLGTGVACLMAGEKQGRAVFLISPFSSARSLAERMVTPPLAALALRDPFESQENLLRHPVPVFIFHGTADPIIPYAEGKALADSLGERSRLVTFRDVGHNNVFANGRMRIMADALAQLAHAK